MKDLQSIARHAISLIDLTSLTGKENTTDIINLCQQAKSLEGNVAAICIYPQHIITAKKQLTAQDSTSIRIATVTNFPKGQQSIELVLQETESAIALGADEIDLVFPYRSLIDGNKKIGFDMVKACKKICGADITLKVIIETGKLKTEDLINIASEICIKAGADFIKTSTGTVEVNATLKSAEIILKTIKRLDKKVGFKVSGGDKSTLDAQSYILLATEIFDKDWVNIENFRFGASSLLAKLLNSLGHYSSTESKQSGY